MGVECVVSKSKPTVDIRSCAGQGGKGIEERKTGCTPRADVTWAGLTALFRPARGEGPEEGGSAVCCQQPLS